MKRAVCTTFPCQIRWAVAYYNASPNTNGFHRTIITLSRPKATTRRMGRLPNQRTLYFAFVIFSCYFSAVSMDKFCRIYELSNTILTLLAAFCTKKNVKRKLHSLIKRAFFVEIKFRESMGRLLSATSVQLGLVDYWKGVNRLYKFLGTILYLTFSFKNVFFGR